MVPCRAELSSVTYQTCIRTLFRVLAVAEALSRVAEFSWYLKLFAYRIQLPIRGNNSYGVERLAPGAWVCRDLRDSNIRSGMTHLNTLGSSSLGCSDSERWAHSNVILSTFTRHDHPKFCHYQAIRPKKPAQSNSFFRKGLSARNNQSKRL